MVALEQLLSAAQQAVSADTQEALAEHLSNLAQRQIASADLSKARRGYVADAKWKAITLALAAVLPEGNGTSTSEAAALRAHFIELQRQPSDARLPNLEAVLADDTLRDSYYEWLWSRKRNENFWKRMEEADVEYTSAAYSDVDDRLRTLLDALEREICAEASRSDRRAWPVPGEEYKKLFRWVTAHTTPNLLLFPFFWTQARRTEWGCIRYGWHRRIGVLIRRASVPVISDDITLITPDIFADALAVADSVEHLVGYSVEQIVFELLANRGDANLINRFRRALTHEPADSVRDAAERLTSTSIFVFDLERLPEVNAYLKPHAENPEVSRLALCSLAHGQKVPVGIGFSLAAFPWLAERKRFETFRQTALRALAGVRRDFDTRLGIELDEIEDVHGRNKA
jgi:hypothetical protein